MNYLNKFFCSPRSKLITAVIIGVASWALSQGVTNAVAPIPSNTLPESSDFSSPGNNVWVHVASYDGVSYFLDAQNATVRIYSSIPNPKLYITNGSHCIGNGPDAGATEAEATTIFRFFALKPKAVAANDYTSAPYERFSPEITSRSSSDLACGEAPPIPLSNPYTAVTDPGYAQFGQYAWEIEARWITTGASGWNGFKYRVDTGRLSYYAGSGDRFALKAQPTSRGNMSMGFAPNCYLQGDLNSGNPTTVRLNWFDADAGVSNQGPSPVRTAIIEYDQNNNQTNYAVPIVAVKPGTADIPGPGSGILNIRSGNNEDGWADIIIRGHHKYRWVWYDISSSNGIQFQLPTDSYNTLIDFNNDCDTSAQANDAACVSITATPASPRTGTGTTLTIVVRNTGTSTWNRGYSLRQMSPTRTDPDRSVSRDNVARNATVQFTYALGARGSPGPVTFNYRMVNDDGNLFGPAPVCSITVTWTDNPPSSEGGITPGCADSSVFVNNITAMWRPPPATNTGAPTTISFVPAVIVITDTTPGGPGPFSYIVQDKNTGNYGIPNNGVATVDTFNMWPAMYPNKTYSLQLYVQGSSGATSQTYDNNGFWNPTNNANAVPGNYYYNDIRPIGPAVTIGGAACFNASCGGPGSADAEPGQTRTLSYGIRITNSTGRTYSANDAGGYSFTVGTSGGLANVSPASPSPANIVPGDEVPININFSARIDYTGQFWIIMNFQGSVLGSLASLPGGDCGNGNTGERGEVTPGTRPYFEVRAGDIATGGGFADATDICPTNAPGYISPATGYSATSGRYDQAGGIRSYARLTPDARGSSSDLGVLSLGLVLGPATDSNPTGFFSRKNAMFANSGVPNSPGGSPAGTSNLGGYLSPNGATQAHCVNDFYTKTRIAGTTPTTLAGNSLSVTGLPTLQYAHIGDLTLNASTIATGQRVTLYVDGNVTIDGNITYSRQYDPTDRRNVPYFSLIVSGDITLTSGVSQLDGLYVAQPRTANDGGTFKTCDVFCPGQLIVNGAVIAQSVQLTRAHGTMGPLDADINNVTINPAEIFNYAPSLLIGLPNFNPLNNGIEALFSLPPVF